MIQKSFMEVHQVLLSSIDNMHVDNFGLQRESGFNVMEVFVRDMDQDDSHNGPSSQPFRGCSQGLK